MKGTRTWLLVCALHGVASMLLWWAGESALATLTWQSDHWQAQPWTLWTSAWVHLGTPHLIGNQLALGALTAFGWMARPRLSAAVAWMLCWPLVQASLQLWPHIGYAVGLSGLLHAGVAVMAMHLVLGSLPIPKAGRWGGLLLAGLVVKLLLEQAWARPVAWDESNQMSVVLAAHLAGGFWGLLLGGVSAWWRPGADSAPRAA